MLKLQISRKVEKFLKKLKSNRKHLKQIRERIDDLLEEKEASDIEKVKGSDNLKKTDIGEYRIIFSIENHTLFVDTIGKRNDGEVYRNF